MKVILIGTPPFIQAGLGERLLTQGHEIHVFENGYAALSNAHSYDADVVIIDRALSDMDPSLVVAHLRHWAPASHPPVMIVTVPAKVLH